MATEIGVLTAKFTAETSNFDRGIVGVERGIKNVTGVMGKLGVGVQGLENLLGGLGGRMSGIGTIASGLGGTLGAVGIGIGIVTAATVGLGTALFGLVKSSAKVGGELFDLSQKTSFTVETLSGLSIAAKTTGSDINGLSPSLVIFQKNMQLAGDATTKQSRLFRILNIDTRDNEKALRQAFAAIGKLGEGSQQTALAMQLFGRSGKDVLAIIKETNGNLDAAIKRYDKMGLVIGTGAASASDKFNDVLEETTLQLEAVTRAIGMELLPVATDALREISNWLTANKQAWSSWGSAVADAVTLVKSIAESQLSQLIIWLGKVAAAMPLALNAAVAAGQRPKEDFFGPGGAARGGRASLPVEPEPPPNPPPIALKTIFGSLDHIDPPPPIATCDS